MQTAQVTGIMDPLLEQHGLPGTANGKDFHVTKTEEEIAAEIKKTDNPDIKCGVGSFKPKFLQILATKEIYLLLYCLVGIIMGMFFTYSVSVISTIEKRFDLSSKQTGIMLAGNDISQVLLSILIAYYGNYGNRPRWMGFGVVCAGLSCFIAATPHYIYGPGDDALAATSQLVNSTNSEGISLCPRTQDESCDVHRDDSGQSYHGPVIILFISQLIVGISISCYYSIGLVYLDDNVSKKDTPLYYGISMINRVMGPVIGFLLGGRCLAMWIDITKSPDIDHRDPRWLGAWWLGYLILAALLSVVGFLLFFFPRQLPSSLSAQVFRLQQKALEKNDKAEYMSVQQYVEQTKVNKKHTKPSLKKLPIALKRLYTNKIWLGNTFNTILTLLAFSGYWSFKPKYLENQFHKSASRANFITGIASLIASVFGIMLGGIVMRIKQPSARYVTGYNVFITFTTSIFMFLLMFVGCPKIDIQGFDSTCSASCDCSSDFLPVCSDDGQTFYSACYAGCTSVIKNENGTIFSNCSCIPHAGNSSYFSTSMPSLDGMASEGPKMGGSAVTGYCPQECDSIYIYVLFIIISKMISASGRVGGTLVYLRSVDEEDKALALGAITVLISLFAFIPGPIIMGSIVDSACLIWDYSCGQRGNCWLYDSDQFRIVMHLFVSALMMVSILGDLVVFYYSKNLKLYEDADVDVEMDTVSDKK